ncbi:hypothetical protein MF271_12010 [Deinococcus sp. KNUC1210]|uniref:hypothetical protein n=1 Tax=Deinococcus sp. KNUC1210 TaxID=2917691 RepID=UPI001EEFA2B3|nr:hypothetical protein [Deinococcus sp. KNUC1210]ULH14720.1 hypothetical protein MF271_12010 [Deinococcus sp. KNUC1210]
MAGVLKCRAAWMLALLSLGGVSAMPAFRLTAIQQLGYDKLDPLWQYSGKVMSCTFCHVNKKGGAPWNTFGQALQQGFVTNPKSNFSQVLYSVLKANGDADGDGYPDAIEVFARTLPGDAASHPDKPLSELEQAFQAAGGVDQYTPKVK